MSADLPGEIELLDLKRRAFLLQQLNLAPDGKLSQSNSNKRIPKQIKDELSLTAKVANDLRSAMVAQGLLVELGGRSHAITDAGRNWLRENRAYVPLKPAPGKAKISADPTVQAWRVAYSLLQLVDAPEEGLSPTELNKRLGPSRLNLDSPTSRLVRGELVVRQLIAVTRNSRSEKYSLTPAGRSRLGECDAALALIFRSSDDGDSSVRKPIDERPGKVIVAPTASQLASAVMELFLELRRERHSVTGLVPIHEVRAAIRHRFGDEAATQSVLNAAILGLWRGKKLRMVPIVDRGRATAAELQDSIPGVGETLFYLESNDDRFGV